MLGLFLRLDRGVKFCSRSGPFCFVVVVLWHKLFGP